MGVIERAKILEADIGVFTWDLPTNRQTDWHTIRLRVDLSSFVLVGLKYYYLEQKSSFICKHQYPYIGYEDK